MGSKNRKFPIPEGFAWSHERDSYMHPDGRRWDDKTNTIYDKDGMVDTGAGSSQPGVEVASAPSGEVHAVPLTSGRKAAMLAEGTAAQSLTTEQLILKEGATAPRVTPADVEAAIKDEKYHRLSGTLMVCELTLQNGFVVTGESACASPENFRESIGRDVSRKNAVAKIWPLLGYELRTRLATNQMIDVGTNFSKQE